MTVDDRQNNESDADAQDIRASLHGDGDAYARLVARYQSAIAGSMWRFTRDRAECEELVHEVFVEAYLGLHGYRGQSPWLHWLQKIATRVGYRYWKSRAKRCVVATLPPEAWQWLTQPMREETDAMGAAETVHAVLSLMSPRDRLVLTLMYLEQCSVAETARRCGWTQTMVKVQAHRARKRLRKMLEEKNQ